MPTYRLIAFAIVFVVCSSAHAQIYVGNLNGASENPVNASAGIGTATVTLDLTANTLKLDIAFSGLSAGTTAAHIHCCIAPPANVGVATQTPTFAGFPSGAMMGTHLQTLDLTAAASFNAPFITNNGGSPASATAALAAGMSSGMAYLNIHTSVFPGGEIRSFLLRRDVFVDGFEGP